MIFKLAILKFKILKQKNNLLIRNKKMSTYIPKIWQINESFWDWNKKYVLTYSCFYSRNQDKCRFVHHNGFSIVKIIHFGPLSQDCDPLSHLPWAVPITRKDKVWEAGGGSSISDWTDYHHSGQPESRPDTKQRNNHKYIFKAAQKMLIDFLNLIWTKYN